LGRDDRRRPRDATPAVDREACAELVRAHYAGIYRFLLHLTRDPDRAADLTQETFAAAWAGLAGFQGRAAPGTWLHRIAYGKFVDAARRAASARVLAETLARRWEDASSSPGPLDSLLADERAGRLGAALQALADESDRVVLVLHYLQGLSFREMAGVLGEPAGTVKWRTSRALERLRALLAGEFDHESEDA
jgi:RNA polymerase sigma-70 factor (ECF subfamily)